MDLNDLRSVTTVILFIAFIGIVVWAYNRRRRDAFDDAAKLPLADDEPPADPPAQERSNGAHQ
jgi:cytochrome c oxidase cbb3-type subunit 4